MKKNNLYILLGLAALGGAWYYMKKKKKGTVIVPEPEKITEQEFNQFQQAEPMQALLSVVKKITTPNAAKKAQKEKLKAATAFANYFGTKKTNVKKVKAKKVGELSVLS